MPRIELTNILLIVLDDIGLDAVGFYNVGQGPVAQIPNLEALAAQGLKFLFAYANPVCSATRATIQTGRYGFRTGVLENVTDETTALQESEVAIPEMLNLGKSGYRHAAFGKWHLGNSSVGGDHAPLEAGYSHFSGSMSNLGEESGGYYSWRKVVDGVATTSTCYATSENISDALDWIASSSQRWFCYLALNAAHTPYHRPPRRLHHIELPAEFENPREEQLMLFRAAIEAADTEIGRLLGSIDLDRTTVIVVGDNGTPGQVIQEPFGRQRDKLTVYEGGIRVPLIVRSSLVKAPGRDVSALANTTDLFATVADLAGVRLGQLDLPTLDSISLLPYMLNPKEESRREFAFAERRRTPESEPPIEWQAIRDDRYKLIVHPRLGEIFYDLQADPYEQGDGSEPDALRGEKRNRYVGLRRELNALLESQGDVLQSRGSAAKRKVAVAKKKAKHARNVKAPNKRSRKARRLDARNEDDLTARRS